MAPHRSDRALAAPSKFGRTTIVLLAIAAGLVLGITFADTLWLLLKIAVLIALSRR